MTSITSGFPKTVFVIPDGNRRQANRLGLPSLSGHRAGYEAFKNIFEAAWKYDIEHLVFWALSFGNLIKRAPDEISYLFDLFHNAIDGVTKRIVDDERDIRFHAVGEWREKFPRELVLETEKLEKETRHHKTRHFTLLLAYDGNRELIQTMQRVHLSIPHEVSANEDVLYYYLPSGHIHSVDLCIRTGCEGDPHLSGGALMYQMANAQLEFTSTLWPDFTVKEFDTIMKNYVKRERRLGV